MVERILVSWSNAGLAVFSLTARRSCNRIGRWVPAQSTAALYTVFAEDLEQTIGDAKAAGLTVHRWVKESARWEKVVAGQPPGGTDAAPAKGESNG